MSEGSGSKAVDDYIAGLVAASAPFEPLPRDVFASEPWFAVPITLKPPAKPSVQASASPPQGGDASAVRISFQAGHALEQSCAPAAKATISDFKLCEDRLRAASAGEPAALFAGMEYASLQLAPQFWRPRYFDEVAAAGTGIAAGNLETTCEIFGVSCRPVIAWYGSHQDLVDALHLQGRP